MLYTDRHLHRFRGLTFKVYDDGHHRIRHFAHSCVIEIGIICSSGNTILDVPDTLDENGRVLHLYVTVLAYYIQAIMSFCHVLAIRIFFEQNIHTLTHEDCRRDAVLLGSLALVLSIETINDITHIIYRDDTLVLRETHIISLRLVLQVIEPGKTLQVVDVATEVDIILYVDTITLRTHDTAIPFSQSQATKPSVSRHTILRQHFPVAYTIQHLDIAVSPRREIHATLALIIGKATILGKIHIGARIRSCLRTFTIFEYELTLLASDDFLYIKVSSEETFMQNEVAIIQRAFGIFI